MVIIIKSDFARMLEAEAAGLSVSMNNIVEPIRTKRNDELNSYFRKQIPHYLGVIDEEEDAEDTLDAINEYLEDIGYKNFPIEFPYKSGSELYILPITPALDLRLLVADEYHGSGEYEKYLMIDRFIMTSETTEEDVDVLVAFVKACIL